MVPVAAAPLRCGLHPMGSQNGPHVVRAESALPEPLSRVRRQVQWDLVRTDPGDDSPGLAARHAPPGTLAHVRLPYNRSGARSAGAGRPWGCSRPGEGFEVPPFYDDWPCHRRSRGDVVAWAASSVVGSGKMSCEWSGDGEDGLAQD
jgi:hypothetical protein